MERKHRQRLAPLPAHPPAARLVWSADRLTGDGHAVASAILTTGGREHHAGVGGRTATWHAANTPANSTRASLSRTNRFRLQEASG